MRVLVADDDEPSRYLLTSLLRGAGHEVVAAQDGLEALALARSNPPDLIVSDILMPGMDGYALCSEWRSDPALSEIPFAFYSANYTEPDDERFALNLGADLFLVKPMEPAELVGQIESLMKLAARADFAPHEPEVDEQEMLKEYNARLVNKLERQLEESRRTNEELERTATRLREMVDGAVTAIAKIVEARDPYTSGHQERVSALAAAIGGELGLVHDEVEGIRIAGLIHDIGKVYVPAEILAKPRRLTDVEFSIVKLHPQVAYDVLAPIDFPWPIADYIIQHHERLDGSGYPNGLRDGETMRGSKILAVADVVEAMSSHRPYKVASGIDAALDEINRHASVLYDAEAVAACVKVFNERGFVFPDAGMPGSY